MKRIQKGFTLIELMIVVAIIGILAAVAIPAYQDYVVKAKLSKLTSTLDPLKLALSMYYQENGSFINSASTSSSAPANFWTSLGLPQGATVPSEIDPSNFVVDGTGLTTATITMHVLAGKIKATTIDANTIVFSGSAAGTAVVWTCSKALSSSTLDPIAVKFFDCK